MDFRGQFPASQVATLGISDVQKFSITRTMLQSKMSFGSTWRTSTRLQTTDELAAPKKFFYKTSETKMIATSAPSTSLLFSKKISLRFAMKIFPGGLWAIMPRS